MVVFLDLRLTSLSSSWDFPPLTALPCSRINLFPCSRHFHLTLSLDDSSGNGYRTVEPLDARTGSCGFGSLNRSRTVIYSVGSTNIQHFLSTTHLPWLLRRPSTAVRAGCHLGRDFVSRNSVYVYSFSTKLFQASHRDDNLIFVASVCTSLCTTRQSIHSLPSWLTMPW